MVCPECGRQVGAKEGRRRASPWRPGRFGVALGVGAVLAWVAPMAKTTSWQRHVPVTVLIGVKHTLGPATPERLRQELDRRMWQTPLTGWRRDWVLPALATDLRRDRVSRNAGKAIAHLMAIGDPGRLQLERCLRSDDAQERRLAARALRDLHVPWERIGYKDGAISGLVGEPSDDLLRVTLEFLGDMRPGWQMGIGHARDPYAFLGLFPERVAPMVAAGMACDDEGHRLRCAGLAALMRSDELRTTAGAILIDALGHNERRRDASFAVRALYCMGPDAAEPLLEPYLYEAEPQKRALVRLVFQNLRKEGKWPGEFPDPEGLRLLTWPGYVEQQLAGTR